MDVIQRLPKRGAQGGELKNQQVATAPLGQRQGEKIGAALDPDALVAPHGAQRNAMLGFVPQPSLSAPVNLVQSCLYLSLLHNNDSIFAASRLRVSPYEGSRLVRA